MPSVSMCSVDMLDFLSEVLSFMQLNTVDSSPEMLCNVDFKAECSVEADWDTAISADEGDQDGSWYVKNGS